MTEGFRSPPLTENGQEGYADLSAARQQEVNESVRRIMGDDIAPAAPVSTNIPAVASGSDSDSSTTEVAKQEAADVADTAKQAGAQVAGTVTEQAGQVTAEAGKQAKQLLAQAQSELSEQAANTQQRVSEGLRSLADELSAMASNSGQSGVATDFAQQAAEKAQQAAGWLSDRDPGSLLDEVRSFARKKPGTYLAIALGAGVLAGRLTRGLTAANSDDSSSADAGSQAPASLVSDTRIPATGFTGVDPVIPAVPAGPLGHPAVIGDPRIDLPS